MNQGMGGTENLRDSSAEVVGIGATMTGLKNSQSLSPQQIVKRKNLKAVNIDPSRVVQKLEANRYSEGSNQETLQELKDAIIELYLAIKIRSTEEVRNQNLS